MTFSRETIQNINQVFRSARADSRETLYEHEVYQILSLTGLEVPKFYFVKNPEEVNADILKKFESKIVIKIVSPQIAHKQKLGGVKIVQNEEPLYIQYVMTRMREEVIGRYTGEGRPEIKGFLILEFIPFTQALGNEVLIGFKEDAAFGPVLTVSKGGDDAEFFSKYFDPADLFLPPLEYDDALKMFQNLHIRQKFDQIGHPEYLEYMARATAILSRLAESYSIIADSSPEFIIKSFEINPFVITLDGRFVAVDGYAQFIPAALSRVKLPTINLHNIESFFTPRGIAVVGVSSEANKYSLGREIAHVLHDLGRKDIYFVNTKGGTIKLNNVEYPLYQKIADIPEPVELIVYTAPTQFIASFMRNLAGTRTKSIIIISGIPSEVNYRDFVDELRQSVPEGIRILGPNCMGVFWAADSQSNDNQSDDDPGVNTLFVEEKRLEIKSSSFSNTVLLTQSGAFAVTAIDKLQNSRIFKSVVSFGNKVDVKIIDLVAYFAKQKGVDVLSLYIEGLDPGEGRQFFELARTMSKPVLVYKAGRTEAGARAAASHTASMSGSYDVFKAACQQSGIILSESLGEHYDNMKVFSLLAKEKPLGNRVAGVVNAGFESTVGADELQELSQAGLSPETVNKLNRINKYGLVDTSTPFLDITPMADDRMYADFVEAILQDEAVDCVFVAIVPHAVALKTTPETCRHPESLANLLVGLNRKYQKPMVVSVNAGRYYQDFVSIMEENGLPVYTDIRSAIKSLDTFMTFHLHRKRQ